MATLAAIRDGIQTRLLTIAGLNAYDNVAGPPVFPAALIVPADVEYDAVLSAGDKHEWHLIVEVTVQAADLRAAQDQMDGYWDPSSSTSVINAIEGDQTLGGIVDYAVVRRAEGYELTDAGLTSRLHVEVVG